jgi:large repetitive protein
MKFALPLLTAMLFAAGCHHGGTSCNGSKCTPAPTHDMGGVDGGVNEVVCAHAKDPAPASGTCSVTAGDASLIITGTVLVPGQILRGGQVAVDGSGVIQCVACDCSASAATTATQVSCPQGVISPGLINPHDHITYTQNSPAADSGERYEQRNDWREGLRGHTKISTPGGASKDEVHWGELRFLMSGATATIGSGGVTGFLRNLDVGADLEGLQAYPVDNDTFPLNDTSGNQLASGCAYPALPTMSTVQYDNAYQAHVSEGIDSVAHNEFVCLSGGAGGETVTLPQSSFVHAVALGPTDYQTMAASGTALVWSPRSNIRLYGDTASVAEADRLGVQIALGTDWTASGSMNMQRELACADGFNKTYLDGYFSDEQLWLMTTRNAAYSVNDENLIGTLAKGLYGDVAIFNGAVNKDHRAVIAAQPADVVLVLRGGKPLYGDADVMTAMGTSCDALDVCGTMKSVCAMSETGETLAALTTANANSYGAFFCGAPDNEPTCTPMRTAAVNGSSTYTGMPSKADKDGDGIADAMDNCPSVFNPIRPLDNGTQADADGDGIGDACDPCPLQTGGGCMSTNPDDIDADGISDSIDNCIGVANPDQADADSDGRGDACDKCPALANPYPMGCPASIYDVKSGTVAAGAQVSIANVLVTAVIPKSGFYVQVKETDGAGVYMGPENSGLFIYYPSASSTTPVVGSRVNVSTGIVQSFAGELELTSVSYTAGTTTEDPPAPVTMVNGGPLTPDLIATGGSEAAALEGVIVAVENVDVTDVMPAPGTGDKAPTNEFVAGGVRVDDLFYLTAPFPTVGINYGSIAGVLVYRYANSKIEPRSAGDVVLGPPILVSLGPNAFIRANTTGFTIPTSAPMVVTLSRAAPANTDVTLTVAAGDQSTLTVTSPVTVMMGQSTAKITVTGGTMRNPTPVTITATLNGRTATGTVRVLDDGTIDVPALTAVSPATAKVAFGGSIAMNAVLDLPAPAGFPVIALSDTAGWTLPAPAQATVMTDDVLGPFTVTQSNATLTDTVTAAVDAQMQSATLTVDAHIVINEVDYDNIGTDSAEFVELYNPTPVDLPLANLAILTATTPTSTAKITALSSAGATLPSHKYLVVGPSTLLGTPAVLPANCTALVNFSAATNDIANGPPVGVALVDTSAMTVIDSVSFDGKSVNTPKNWPAAINFYEGAGTTTVADSNSVQQSLSRKTLGIDNDDTAGDWVVAATPTPCQ